MPTYADNPTESTRDAFGLRCTHGLKAGNCNTCAATRDAETNAWSFDAIGRGRTRTIGGRTYRCNRHGIVCMENGSMPDGSTRWNAFFYWNEPTPECEREYRSAIYAAFARVGIGATCGNATGYCSCPARF